MLRLLDIVLSLIGLVLSLPLLLILMGLGFLETGFPLFRQVRVGRHLKPFTLIKLRTMTPGTPSVASHLADRSTITTFGRFLRSTKLDELPQLWNVLKGEMSLVGPRPCLFNQEELVHIRTSLGVYEFRPGITGLAQLSGIDMSTPQLLAETDRHMLDTLNTTAYFRYIFRTLLGKGWGDRVR